MITGIAPYAIPHGLKIDQMNAIETVIEGRNGQILGPGSSSVCCGSESRLLVTRTSGISSRTPATIGWFASASHKASRPFTLGSYMRVRSNDHRADQTPTWWEGKLCCMMRSAFPGAWDYEFHSGRFGVKDRYLQGAHVFSLQALWSLLNLELHSLPFL